MTQRYKRLEKLAAGVGKSGTRFESNFEGHTLVADEPLDRICISRSKGGKLVLDVPE